ncbi:MAG: class I SAM-dependent methyltransferase, partial [Pseudomonadota bacterium]|nr:class I SAM-dependent methyltransferase [Pseudomonadota bacterium]
HLDAFLDRLAPGASVLELGCGAGRDSARIAERGFTLEATDGTPAMVRKANERFGIAARVMRFDELDAKETYDAVWAHACLLHVARADLPGVLASVHAALRENGLHFANYKLGIAEGRDPLGRLTNLPDEEWLEQTYRAAGFAILATQRYRGKGADGVQRDWYALTLRKEAA